MLEARGPRVGADIAVLITEHDAVDYDRIVTQAPRIYATANATRDVSEHREKIQKL